MRVLVTGHQGYLGTVMVPVLQAAGHEVTGLDSGLFADCVLGAEPNDPPGIRTDLRDVAIEQITGFFDGLDLVDPGVISTPLWRPKTETTPEPIAVYCAVARKA